MSETRADTVSFSEAVRFWLKLGFISFGGPAGQIAIMHQELVEKRRWISEPRFLHALNYCMLLPGPEAQQLATYMGWLMHGSVGGIVAGVLFILPSLVLLIVLSWIYIAFGDMTLVAGLFYGIKPAVTAIVIHAAFRIGSRTLYNAWLWCIAGSAFIAIFFLKLPFPMIVLGAAVCGYLGGRLAPGKFSKNPPVAEAGSSIASAPQATITPPPHRTLRLLLVFVCGLLLWLIPIVTLTALCGWQHALTQMAWFFTKAALLTIGGAYAVLPYVYQGAVEHYGWLSPTQMIDGLALGETTPGPLIIVVAFVGFIGGYVNAVFGPDSLFIAGATAAIIVTWFTFLPSFMFILIGGPIVESTHGNLNFTAPLSAITAAVVGVVLNLALFFGFHVLWPAGFDGAFDTFSALVAISAVIALFCYQQSVTRVIIFCALIGLVVAAVQS